MPGLGTIVNAAGIVAGGLIGLLFGKFLTERYQETITRTMGFATIVLALGSVMSQMLKVEVTQTGGTFDAALNTVGTMMMVISMAIGAFIGEFINLHKAFESFGGWLRDKTGSQNDTGFINAFVTSSLTVCVGAMAIMGSIQDGVSGDHSTLFAKAILDMVIIIVMTAGMGKGCIFSAIPVLILQGSITILAGFLSPVLTTQAINNLSYVGNVLIVCVGVNLVWPGTIRVANLLPAVVIATLAAYIPY